MGKSKYSRVAQNKVKESQVVKKNKISAANPPEQTSNANNKGFAIMIIVIALVGMSIYGVMVAVEESNKPTEGAYNTITRETSQQSQSTQQNPTTSNSSYGVDITLTTIEGKVIKLSDYAGRSVVLFFFYLSCPYCNYMEPELLKAANSFGDQVKVFAIDVQPNADSADELEKWRQDNGYTDWEVVRDVSGYLTNAFEVTGTPKTYYLDTKGDIYTVHLGYKEQVAIEQAISGSLS